MIKFHEVLMICLEPRVLNTCDRNNESPDVCNSFWECLEKE
jgi:hypothetical protein